MEDGKQISHLTETHTNLEHFTSYEKGSKLNKDRNEGKIRELNILKTY
jgi:hypothetical protein